MKNTQKRKHFVVFSIKPDSMRYLNTSRLTSSLVIDMPALLGEETKGGRKGGRLGSCEAAKQSHTSKQQQELSTRRL